MITVQERQMCLTNYSNHLDSDDWVDLECHYCKKTFVYDRAGKYDCNCKIKHDNPKPMCMECKFNHHDLCKDCYEYEGY